VTVWRDTYLYGIEMGLNNLPEDIEKIKSELEVEGHSLEVTIEQVLGDYPLIYSTRIDPNWVVYPQVINLGEFTENVTIVGNTSERSEL
jgi:hypothetical protein